MAFSYAMNIVLEERVFQNRSLLKKEYTLYQRSILNKIFRKGNKKINIPFDLKVLYLKPEYVDKFKVADLKITTEQTESSNLRLHRIEFVLEDKVSGMLLKRIQISALGEISNGKESLNTLPYKKTVLIGVDPLNKKEENQSEINKDNDQKTGENSEERFENLYPEIKTKVPFSEIKNSKPDKKYSSKGKNHKKRKHHKNQQKKKS